MKTMKKPNNDRSFAGASLLRLAVEIASHPAFAGFTPAGPASLATGQGGRICRRGNPGPHARQPVAQANYSAFAGSAAELGCHGCS